MLGVGSARTLPPLPLPYLWRPYFVGLIVGRVIFTLVAKDGWILLLLRSANSDWIRIPRSNLACIILLYHEI